MPNRPVNLEDLAFVAKRLDPAGVKFAFVGASVIPLLLDSPQFAEFRSTEDTDAVFEVTTHLALTKLDDRLRELGLKNDMSEGAPRCRWLVGEIKLDVLPARADPCDWTARWMEEALRSAETRTVHGVRMNVISAPCFVACKMDAFHDPSRGKNDFAGSKDVEDIITVVDGRKSIVSDVWTVANPELREYIAQTAANWFADQRFRDALPGNFPDAQDRLVVFMERWQEVAAMRIGG